MPQPTCKVAVVAGKRGAQIYPKGCKVRRRVDKKGRTTKTNTRGKAKQTVAAAFDQYVIYIAVNGTTQYAPFIWDTGASVTMMGHGTAKQCKLLDANGQAIGPHGTSSIVYANGQRSSTLVFKAKKMVVYVNQKQYTITTDIHVVKNGQRLLGVPAIRALRKKGLVVKFN